MPTATLSIGDFSRATHLTIKTLRHYHRIGLLEPAEVDASSGYRRYGTDQIAPALIISRFRALDMPLDAIQDVLSAPDLTTRNAVIVAHLERLETALEHTRAAAESLRALLTDAPARSSPIEHVAVAGTSAAAITDVIRTDSSATAWLIGAIGELRATLAAQGTTITGPAGGIFADELFTEEQGEATIFIPYTGELHPVGRITPVAIPAAELATITHRGSHDDIDAAYGALGAYVAEHALAVPGPLREDYVTGPADTADATRWITRIGWPIFRTTP